MCVRVRVCGYHGDPQLFPSRMCVVPLLSADSAVMEMSLSGSLSRRLFDVGRLTPCVYRSDPSRCLYTSQVNAVESQAVVDTYL